MGLVPDAHITRILVLRHPHTTTDLNVLIMQIRVMVQLPACGWRIMNTLITPALVQQAIVALASSVFFTLVPLLSSLGSRGVDVDIAATSNATAT